MVNFFVVAEEIEAVRVQALPAASASAPVTTWNMSVTFISRNLYSFWSLPSESSQTMNHPHFGHPTGQWKTTQNVRIAQPGPAWSLWGRLRSCLVSTWLLSWQRSFHYMPCSTALSTLRLLLPDDMSGNPGFVISK